MDILSWLGNWASIISLGLMAFGEMSFFLWWRKHNKMMEGLSDAFSTEAKPSLVRKLGIDAQLSNQELHDKILGYTDFFIQYNKTIQNKLPRNLLASVWGSSTLKVPRNAVHLKAYTLLLEVRYLTLLAEKHPQDKETQELLAASKALLQKYGCQER